MPTFTTIALENLLEPNVRDSSSSFKTPLKSADNSEKSLASHTSSANNDSIEKQRDQPPPPPAPAPNHIYISPALYITPEPAPIPDISSEFSSSPSPYVVNHKGRGGARRIGRSEIPSPSPSPLTVALEQKEERAALDLRLDLGKEEEGDNFLGVEVENEGFKGVENEIMNEYEEQDANEFVDPISSSSRFDSRSFISAQSFDFFDARDDFSSDGSMSSASSYGHATESELRKMKMNLLEEIGKRKAAEEIRDVMQTQWQRISNLLANAGLTLPPPPNAGENNASLEQLSQEIIVSRIVTEALSKGEGRAEAEEAAQAILEAKEQEMSRLRDRLQYYEAVNHEMSQRNQEIVEVSRKLRQKKKRQRKWLWSCVGLTVAIGASVVAYSYLPTTKNQQLPSTSDSADPSASVSDIGSSETA